MLYIVVYLLSTVNGMSSGWVAPVLNNLKNSHSEFSLSAEECSWIASAHYITRILAPLPSAVFIHEIGHRLTHIIIAGIYLTAWVFTVTTRSVFFLYIIRLILGTAIGMFETTSSIYIADICSPKIRGIANGVFVTFLYGGFLLSLILGTYFSYKDVALIHTGIALLTLLSTFLLREPAIFLILKGKMEEAERTYYWLRSQKNINLQLEFEEIKENALQENSKMSLTELFNSPEVNKSLRIVFILNFLIFCSGFAAINSFISMTFSNTGYFNANEMTIIFGVCQLVSCFISSLVMDRFNRRTLWHTACILGVVSHSGTAILYYVPESKDAPYFEWLLFITLTTYSCVFAMLMLPLASAARGELLPVRVKPFGNCIAVIAGSATGFVTTKIFLPITEAYGIQINFIFFSTICLLTFFYEYFDLPETRGVSLVSIQKSLKSGVSTIKQVEHETFI